MNGGHLGQAYGVMHPAQSFIHQPAYPPHEAHYQGGTPTIAGEVGSARNESLSRDWQPASYKSGKQAPPRKKDRKIARPAPPPTAEYNERVLHNTFAVDPPEAFLIVLDLNGTLIYRPDRNKPTHLVARPFLKPFLQYLFKKFHVMVWSSAMPTNVKKIVKNVLDEELQSKLVAAWGRDTFGLPSEFYHQNVQVYKDLRLIWDKEEIQQHHPGHHAGQRFGQHNTILLDDSKLKAHAQPYNLIEIPEFTATKEQMKSDILREVAGYLQVAKMQSNVSNFMMQYPFKANGRWQYDWPDDLAEAGEMHERAHLHGGLASASHAPVTKDAAVRAPASAQNAAKGQQADEDMEEDVPMGSV